MKRSSFKPKPRPERAPVVLRPLTRVGVHAVCTAAVPVPKGVTERDEGYRRWVASLPCVECGLEGFSQAAHPNQGRGLGQKASDLDCFPLCATRPGEVGCHVRHDQLIGLTLKQRREREADYIARMRFIAAERGRKEIDT